MRKNRFWRLGPTILGLSLVLLLGFSTQHWRQLRAQATLHTLTMADSNTTLTVPVGDSIELRLSTDDNWDVSISDPTVLRRPPVALIQGVQGLWNAVMPGESVITATGTAKCAAGVPCPQFAILFQATIDVTGSSTGGPPGSGASVTFPRGWNLVGGPADSTFLVPLFIYDSAGGQYQTLDAGRGVKGGYGYWAFFSVPTTIAFTSNGSPSATLPIFGGQWQQVADPSATASVTVTGADVVYTYDPTGGQYNQATTLMPGQGAWVYAASDGSVQLSASGTLSVQPPLINPTPGQTQTQTVASASPAASPIPAASVQHPSVSATPMGPLQLVTPTPAAPQPSPSASAQGRSCGTVQERGPTGAGVAPGSVLNGSDAQQAEQCFVQAYQQCSSATLTVRIMGIDTSQTHTFALSGGSGACVVTDTVQSFVAPRGGLPARTVTCAAFTQQQG
ncbi:MAG: hypothetical protein ACR2PL_23035, partial [Dehalococcoidia bacterium]